MLSHLNLSFMYQAEDSRDGECLDFCSLKDWACPFSVLSTALTRIWYLNGKCIVYKYHRQRAGVLRSTSAEIWEYLHIQVFEMPKKSWNYIKLPHKLTFRCNKVKRLIAGLYRPHLQHNLHVPHCISLCSFKVSRTHTFLLRKSKSDCYFFDWRAALWRTKIP